MNLDIERLYTSHHEPRMKGKARQKRSHAVTPIPFWRKFRRTLNRTNGQKHYGHRGKNRTKRVNAKPLPQDIDIYVISFE